MVQNTPHNHKSQVFYEGLHEEI